MSMYFSKNNVILSKNNVNFWKLSIFKFFIILLGKSKFDLYSKFKILRSQFPNVKLCSNYTCIMSLIQINLSIIIYLQIRHYIGWYQTIYSWKLPFLDDLMYLKSYFIRILDLYEYAKVFLRDPRGTYPVLNPEVL